MEKIICTKIYFFPVRSFCNLKYIMYVSNGNFHQFFLVDAKDKLCYQRVFLSLFFALDWDFVRYQSFCTLVKNL